MNTEFRVLLRTGKLYQLDAADLALKDAGLPHNLQEESVSGLRAAMPIDPSPAPGTWWTILVPADRFDEASEVISSLPYKFTTEPDVWDCSPSPRGKKILTIVAWAAIISIVVAIISALTRA
jgi:hypothetical protein